MPPLWVTRFKGQQSLRRPFSSLSALPATARADSPEKDIGGHSVRRPHWPLFPPSVPAKVGALWLPPGPSRLSPNRGLAVLCPVLLSVQPWSVPSPQKGPSQGPAVRSCLLRGNQLSLRPASVGGPPPVGLRTPLLVQPAVWRLARRKCSAPPGCWRVLFLGEPGLGVRYNRLWEAE